MTTTHAQRKALGDYGERLAARHLSEAGYEILDRNWRCSEGELDIVASLDGVIVGCEVKTRTSNRFGSPLQAITQAKAARLYRLIGRWAAAHGARYSTLRVDVVCVLRPPRGEPVVEHLEGVV